MSMGLKVDSGHFSTQISRQWILSTPYFTQAGEPDLLL